MKNFLLAVATFVVVAMFFRIVFKIDSDAIIVVVGTLANIGREVLSDACKTRKA